MLPGPAHPHASSVDHGFFGLAQPAGAEVVGVGIGVLLLVGGALVLGAGLEVAGVLLCTGLVLGAGVELLDWVGVAVGVGVADEL
ncbi:MAG TPA: hypothetical protein VJ851_17095 [Jatrophihabitans sp.]|nr:hypothetical protein [Jatrophihabitans sp.]